MKARATARLDAIRAVEHAKLGGADGTDTWAQPVAAGPETRALRVRVEFPEGDYANFTDVALEIEDGRGKRLAGRGMGTREEEFEVSLPAGTDQCAVRIKAGYADEWDHPRAEATVTIDRLLRTPIEGRVKAGDGETLLLHPGASLALSAKFTGEAPDFGPGMALWGRILLTNEDGGATIAEAEINAGRE